MVSLNIQNKLTFEEFRNRIARRLNELTKEDTLVCPLCQRDEGRWNCIGYAELVSESWDDSEAGRFLVFPVICDQCGFVAHFAVEEYND